MNTKNPASGNDTGLPKPALPTISDMHFMAIRLNGLAGALDEIYRGGGGDKGQIGALMEAVFEKSRQIMVALEANYEAGIGS